MGRDFVWKFLRQKGPKIKFFKFYKKSNAWKFLDFLHKVAKLPQGVFITENLAQGQKEVQNEVFKFCNRFHLYSKISDGHIFGKTVANISLQNILVFLYKKNLICRCDFSSVIWIAWKLANFCVANSDSQMLNASSKSKNWSFYYDFSLTLKKCENLWLNVFSLKYCD